MHETQPLHIKWHMTGLHAKRTHELLCPLVATGGALDTPRPLSGSRGTQLQRRQMSPVLLPKCLRILAIGKIDRKYFVHPLADTGFKRYRRFTPTQRVLYVPSLFVITRKSVFGLKPKCRECFGRLARIGEDLRGTAPGRHCPHS